MTVRLLRVSCRVLTCHSGAALALMKMKSLLQSNKADIALVIGNGINLYKSENKANSWDGLLAKLAEKYHIDQVKTEPGKTELAGIALTEFYDILDLKLNSSTKDHSLQQEFCDLLSSLQCYNHHQHIVKWAQKADRPILTTNFDQVLSDAGKCRLHRTIKTGFTDFYPWETYYGTKQIDNPAKGFGIWHVNGMQHYHRSIRLGLSHYMGSVERARGWLHKGNERRLFSGKNISDWAGAASWLHIIFNSELLIFGLKLEVNEVFLRWILIERARYFKMFPDRHKAAWYVYAGEKNSDGKQFFLKSVGVRPWHVDSYDDIYGAAIWK